jgi:hypothetical protein
MRILTGYYRSHLKMSLRVSASTAAHSPVVDVARQSGVDVSEEGCDDLDPEWQNKVAPVVAKVGIKRYRTVQVDLWPTSSKQRQTQT